MKYAFLVPMGQQMVPSLLFQQWLPFQKWLATNEDYAEICSVIGPSQVHTRDQLLKSIDAEWYIWVDADIKFSLPQIRQLMFTDELFVAGWYARSSDKGEIHSSVAIKNPTPPGYIQLHPSEVYHKKETFECDWTALGFAKIHQRVIDQLPQPYFTHKIIHGDLCAVDLSFCLAVYQHTKIKPKIIPSLNVGHIKWTVL